MSEDHFSYGRYPDPAAWLTGELRDELKKITADRDRLAGEVERLKAEIDNIKQVEFPKRAEAITKPLLAERDRLAGKVASLKETITTAVRFNEELAAERDRLKAALDEAVKWMDGCAVSGGYPAWHAKARKALGGGAS